MRIGAVSRCPFVAVGMAFTWAVSACAGDIVKTTPVDGAVRADVARAADAALDDPPPVTSDAGVAEVPPPPAMDPPPAPPPPPAEPAWMPPALGATRFVVFYQMSPDILPVYADPTTGLPMSSEHAAIFAISHTSVVASRFVADQIHGTRSDFKYAPCFDVNERDGWSTASDDELARMAHEFRDEAIAAHADLFCYNELVSVTPSNDGVRVRQMKLLRFLNDPDAHGARLRGVLFLTEAAATARNWTTPASAFWTAVDDTCDAVVAEHFHGQSYVCTNTMAFLSSHYVAMREWLTDSGESAKVSIANRKFMIMHSSYYGPGGTGWGGANSSLVTIGAFQRDLSRVAKVTRNTLGGWNRIGFGPMTNSVTDSRVHPRIALLVRWHYGQGGTAAELGCVAGAAVNCECD